MSNSGEKLSRPLYNSIQPRKTRAHSLYRVELRQHLRGGLYTERNGCRFVSANTPRSCHIKKACRRGVIMCPLHHWSHTCQHVSGSSFPTVKHTLGIQGPACRPFSTLSIYFLYFSRRTPGLSPLPCALQTHQGTSMPPPLAPVPGRSASSQGLSTVSFQGHDSWTKMNNFKRPSRKPSSEGQTLFLSCAGPLRPLSSNAEETEPKAAELVAPGDTGPPVLSLPVSAQWKEILGTQGLNIWDLPES